MERKLYVGGVSWKSTSEDLRAAFEQFGTVEDAVIIMDRETGRSKGFGFVTMSTEEEAQAAITGLNDTELDGRKVRVMEAQPKEDRPRTGGFRKPGNFSRDDRF